MTGALSDQDWADICAAAGRANLTPDAKARAMLSAILFSEYPAFAYDPAREAARLKRSERTLKLLSAAVELYRQEWLPHLAADELQAILTRHAMPWLPRRMNFKPTFNAKTKRDLDALQGLYLRTEAVWHYASVIRRANKGRKSPQNEWLYHRLCSVWLDHFGAPDLHPGSREPAGPLIAFMLAATSSSFQGAICPRPRRCATPSTASAKSATSCGNLCSNFN